MSDIIEARVCGIPCQIEILSFFCQPPHKGSPWTCDSDWDYYGYTEAEWNLLDRKGYRAKWLEAKVEKENAHEEVEEAIKDYFDNYDPY